MGRLKILVVDDDQVLRDGLAALIGFDSSLGETAVTTARDGQEALVRCIADPPDLVVMDIRMPRMDGVEATRRIVREHPGIKVLALTTFTTQEYVAPMLAAGASGYLVKDHTDELVPAIRSVLDDEFYITPKVSEVLVRLAMDKQRSDRADEQAGAEEASEKYPPLSPQELSAVGWLARGYSNAEIARAMELSLGSVKSYLAKAGDKLRTRDRVQLLIRASELGLVSPAIEGGRD